VVFVIVPEPNLLRKRWSLKNTQHDQRRLRFQIGQRLSINLSKKKLAYDFAIDRISKNDGIRGQDRASSIKSFRVEVGWRMSRSVTPGEEPGKSKQQSD
jgi:hypothetical protein